ncbi:hypothetical protein LSCM1_07396 [Leishmania martiniquensis]|uniref:Uncharacterized protein n=1 Tax=Leishmania martiniquensis TaxID=1580590 RepID=A0A836HTQ6_9TRYP|nr:hypothetical protein LSCM1_07396 [Leishmania martiniquensis]
MSFSGMNEALRPSSPEAQLMATETLEHQEYQNSPHEDEEEQYEAAPRTTCKPSAVPAQMHAEGSDEEAAATSPVSAELEREKHCEAAAETLIGGAAPAEIVWTARPRDVKKAKKTKKPSRRAKEAKPTAPPRAKPMLKVSISNVERQPPIPEGVNTPRSVALCKEQGVNPCELAPYGREHFQGFGVSDEVTELRYQSYEKRRRARMAQLAPAYKEMAKASANHSVSFSAKKRKAHVDEEAPTQTAAVEQEAGQLSNPMDEEAEMQRQFEVQHQRLLEQERRKTVASGYDSNGHRRSPPRAGHSYGPSVRSAGSFKSPGRYSRGTSVGTRPTVGQPYSAAKIYSASIVENRPLTQGELMMIYEINEREARRTDTQERAFVIQENKQLMHVERELIRERHASVRVQKNAEDRRKMQVEMYKRTQSRQKEVAERRRQLEAERQVRLRNSIAEKDVRVHTVNPYASLLARQMSGFSSRRTSRSVQSQGANPSASLEQTEAAE